MSLEDVLPVARSLAASAEALAVLASGSAGEEAPRDDVLVALGLDPARAELTVMERELLAGVARTVLLQAVEVVDAPARPAGWNHVDPRLLRGQGVLSATLLPVLASKVVPTLAGLAARLETPGGAFLDVGVGVGEISIAMAHTWPELAIVGIDPFESALDARERPRRGSGRPRMPQTARCRGSQRGGRLRHCLVLPPVHTGRRARCRDGAGVRLAAPRRLAHNRDARGPRRT